MHAAKYFPFSKWSHMPLQIVTIANNEVMCKQKALLCVLHKYEAGCTKVGYN